MDIGQLLFALLLFCRNLSSSRVDNNDTCTYVVDVLPVLELIESHAPLLEILFNLLCVLLLQLLGVSHCTL